MNIKKATEILGKKPSKRVWNNIHKLRYWYVYWKSMCDLYKSTSEAATGEIRYLRMKEDSLVSLINEIEVVTNDPITKRLCQMAIERNEMDSLIHTRVLFPNPKGFNSKQSND